MRPNIIYILMAVWMVVSCDNDMDDGMTYLNGSSKSPITVQTNISSASVTRAFDKTFEENDLLYAYIEAGKMEDGNFVYEEQYMWNGNFTIGETVDNGGAEGVGNITTSDALSPIIYWDDFSDSDYDIRDTDRGIRLKYGYSFNKGEDNATDKDEEKGTLTWTVMQDQDSYGGRGMKQSDLLFAKTQDMVTYNHDEAKRSILYLPYTHAMSKITVKVTTGEGYSAEKTNFASSVMTLNDMQVVADVNAPEDTVMIKTQSMGTGISSSGTADIKAYVREKSNTEATFQAIVAPTCLTEGNVLAHIADIDGNDYNIPITSSILEAWSAEDKMIVTEEIINTGVAQSKYMSPMSEIIDHGKGYVTKSGIHYILNVQVDKQKITIRATITDWENVTAEGQAKINFTGDIEEKGTIAEELQDNGFGIYKSSTNSSFPTKSTTASYISGEWKYSPEVFWAGHTDNCYFRAVSPAESSSNTLTQGIDLMWGTSGNDAITPRTGDVELKFKHLMSKLSVTLETAAEDEKKVDLEDAKIEITNLANTGSYNIVDGSVTPGEIESIMLKDKDSGFCEAVIPQTIGNDARLKITLTDGTTYSLQFNDCVVTGTETPVTEWVCGNGYTYIIHLEKEKISFRAMVKEWEEKTGSGNANLEWD